MFVRKIITPTNRQNVRWSNSVHFLPNANVADVYAITWDSAGSHWSLHQSTEAETFKLHNLHDACSGTSAQ